jgi:hypothetical protein
METEEQNITSLNDYLSFLESPIHRIAKEVMEEGYDIAGHMGIRVSEKNKHPSNMIGILKNKDPLEKRILGIKFNQKQRAELIGELWNNNDKFTLKVYGQDNYLEVCRLVKKHLSAYNIKPKKVIYQDSREESYISDTMI